MSRRWIGHLAVVALLLLAIALAGPVRGADPVDGWASHYGPGTGVAMPFCTWTLRHTAGCGWVRIQSADTGLTVVTPVVDWCYCIVPESDHPRRIVDLQYGVLRALGLPSPGSSDDWGLYQVSVERIGADGVAMPDTSVAVR